MVRAETVVVGRGAKQARRHKLNKEEARAVEWGVQGPRKGRSQQIRNVARSVSEEAVRGVLGEGHGSSNSPQIEVGEEPSTSQLSTIPDQHTLRS